MTEFQELTQDAPNFVSMERGELVAYAYGMFAAGTKANAENAKLREEFDKMDVWHSKELTAAMDENAKLRKLARLMWKPFCWAQSGYEVCLTDEQEAEIHDMARELGVEVD